MTEPSHTLWLDAEPRWANGRVSLPLETMKQLNVSSFKSGSAFELSDDMKSLLHLDARQARAVSLLFSEIRDAFRDKALAHPVAVTETEKGVIFDLEFADPRVADRLREALGGLMDPMRADFLMARAKETFDWEFGGFGRVQKRIEVTILPDDTISVRETLHKPSSDVFGATANAGGERIDPFELAARQYRLHEIPPHLLKYIRIDDQSPTP